MLGSAALARAGAPPLLDVVFDALALSAGRQGPHLGGVVEQIADPDRPETRAQRLDHRVVAMP